MYISIRDGNSPYMYISIRDGESPYMYISICDGTREVKQMHMSKAEQ